MASQHFFEYLEHEREAKASKTIEAYEGDLVDLYRILKSERLVLAGSHDDLYALRRYLHTLSEQLSHPDQKGNIKTIKASSIGRKLAAVRSFVKFLVKQGIFEFNAARLLKTPKAEKNLPNVVSERAMSDVLRNDEGISGKDEGGRMKDEGEKGKEEENSHLHPSSFIPQPLLADEIGEPFWNFSIPAGFGAQERHARSIFRNSISKRERFACSAKDRSSASFPSAPKRLRR